MLSIKEVNFKYKRTESQDCSQQGVGQGKNTKG